MFYSNTLNPTPSVAPTRRRTRLINLGLLGVIVAAGAYLRLRGLETSWVGRDQSIMFSIAMRFVNGGMLPLAANKASAGIMNPPLIEYVLAVPLFVKATVLWATQFYALLCLAGVPILYAYVNRLFGARVGLLAALFFAVNPWAVYYSRFVWNPGPILLFGTLLLCSLLAYFAGRGRSIHLALSFLWLAAVTQLHLSSLVLIPIIGLIGLILWRRWQRANWRRTLVPLLLGISLFLLLYVPYLLYERGVGFGDLQAMVNALVGDRQSVTGEVEKAVVNEASLLLTLEMATGDHIFGVSSDFDAREAWRGAVWPWFPLVKAAYGLFIGSLLYAVVTPIVWRLRPANRGKRAPSRPVAFVILALWITLPVLIYLRHTVYLQNYYFLFLFPAPFILVALLVDDLLTAAAKFKFRWLATGAILLPVLLLTLWQFHVYHVRLGLADSSDVQAERQAQHVDQAAAAGRAVLDRYPGCDMTIVDTAGYLEQAPLGLLEDFIYPRPVRYVETGQGFIIPARCTIYFVAKSDPLLDDWLAAHAELLPEEVNTRRETWRFYHLPGSSITEGRPLASWQNGLELLETSVEGIPAASQQIQLIYTWRVTRKPPPGTHYHFFNHFLDESSGQLVAQEDAPAIHALYWEPGDRLVTQFTLNLPPDLPAGRYVIRTGLYTWPDLQRVNLENETETTFTVRVDE